MRWLFVIVVLSLVVMGLLVLIYAMLGVGLLISVIGIDNSLVGVDHVCVLGFIHKDVLCVVVVAVDSIVVVIRVLVVLSGVPL